MIRKVLILAIAAAAAACTTAPQQQPAGGVILSDNQIAMILQVANEGEVRHGEIARTRGTSQQVRDFADLMVRDHSSARTRLADVLSRANITPAESELSRTLRSGAEQTAQALSASPSRDFDVLYMRTQRDMHDWLLRSIETSLLPAARSTPLTLFLRDQRTAIGRHLEHAQKTLEAVR